MENSWFTTIKEDDTGELYIDLPPEMMKSLGWNENTALWWVFDDNKTGVILTAEEPDDKID